MTPRERVLAALNHQEPDRVPLDLGSTNCTGITKVAYERLKEHLGITKETILLDRVLQLAVVDEEVLERFRIDTRGLFIGSPDNWQDIELPDGSFQDEWGVIRKKPPTSFYYDLISSPFQDGLSEEGLRSHNWPDPLDPGRVRGLAERAEHLYKETDYAVVLQIKGGFITQSQYLRGFEGWFIDLLLEPELLGKLLDRTLDFSIKLAGQALDAIGDNVDVLMFGDDIGIQTGPMFSPEAYRKVIKPRQAKFVGFLKEKSRGKKVLMHTCGSVFELMEDLIEVGIDVYNPVQVTAAKMDPASLKKAFGGRMAFWGGIDSHRVLPAGTPEDVRNEVAKMIKVLAPGGGFVLNSVHNIQPDVPPENICALFDAGWELGRYPRKDA